MRKLLDTFKNVLESLSNYYHGWGFFLNTHVWDLKVAIARFTLSRLKAYQDLIIRGKNCSIPAWIVDDGKSLSEIQALSESDRAKNKEVWIAYLDEMIFAFEYEKDPDKFQDLPYQKCSEKQKQGLQLFVHYYPTLWD